VALGGRYVIAVGDHAIIRRDALVNIVTSMAGVLTLFLFAFRRFGLLLYAFVPLSCGLVVTFGFSQLAFGGLNAATSGVAALLVGLGIDFVIVSYGRFVEERQRGVGLSEALATMNGSSGRAVVVGGVTSAATFFAFGVTDFTGLYEMGFLTGTGILFCMVAVLFLLPSMLAWSEDHHERRESFPRLFLHGFGSAHLIRQSMRHPRLVLGLAAAVSLLAAWQIRGLRFEDSVQAMRPAGNPGVAVRDEVAERFGTGFDQMMLIVRGDTLPEVLELSEIAARGAQKLVEDGVLTSQDSVSALVPAPGRQDKALEWLRQARVGELDLRRIRAVFVMTAAEEGLRTEPFLPGLELLERAISRSGPIRLADLEGSPQAQALLDRYLLPGTEGWKSVVYLHPPAKKWRREPPPQVEHLAEQLGPQAILTGANVVSEFLRRRVLRDAVVAAVLGLVVVGFLLWLDYRRIRDTILSLVPLSIGVLWMLGGIAALGLSMNFMNIFVTTMIIGIGVDYGIHIIHRYREMGEKSMERLGGGLVETGKAIVLAALSTTVGFGSLAISHYPGLRSMGKVAILGATATALVAITVLPAYIALRRTARGDAIEFPGPEKE
jgi:predicted RND superfamily exporter protein